MRRKHFMKYFSYGAVFIFIFCSTTNIISNDVTIYKKEELIEENKHCKKVNKIGYAKLHKCASTSLQNILLRYAVAHNLNVVLPNGDDGYFTQEYEELFSRRVLSETPWEQAKLPYHIFCVHARWNQGEISEILGDGAVYFTMLRHPVDLFISFWDFSVIQAEESLDEVIQSIKSGQTNHMINFVTRNPMLFDLGFDNLEAANNETAVDDMIRQVDKNFDIVLMTARYEESLILLKDLLCWEMRDIENLRLNSASLDSKTRLSEDSKTWLEEYLSADLKLFNYFKIKFDEKLQQFGDKRMRLEIIKLRKQNENMKTICNIETEAAYMSEINKTIVSQKTTSNNPYCRLMVDANHSQNKALVRKAIEVQQKRANKILQE